MEEVADQSALLSLKVGLVAVYRDRVADYQTLLATGCKTNRKLQVIGQEGRRAGGQRGRRAGGQEDRRARGPEDQRARCSAPRGLAASVSARLSTRAALALARSDTRSSFSSSSRCELCTVRIAAATRGVGGATCSSRTGKGISLWQNGRGRSRKGSVLHQRRRFVILALHLLFLVLINVLHAWLQPQPQPQPQPPPPIICARK